MSEREKPGVIINVDQAVVHTATIQIRMLTIDRNKVTMGLFRQIPVRHVLDRKTGELKGTPWGLVNYFWPDCGEYEHRHLHVLWQDDDCLYRDCVLPTGWDDRPADLAKHSDQKADLMAWSVVYQAPELLTMEPYDDDGRYYLVQRKGESRGIYLKKESEFRFVTSKLSLWRGPAERRWDKDGGHLYVRPYGERHALEQMLEWLGKFNAPVDPAECWAKSFDEMAKGRELWKQAKTLQQRWETEFRSLASQVQLYIAG